MPAQQLTTNPAIRRYAGNPVLSSKDIPYEADLIFNAGAIKRDGRYVMMFRNDHGKHLGPGNVEKRSLGIAYSDDGYTWAAEKTPVDVELNPFFKTAYDPRLIVVDGQVYTCFCFTENGTRGAIATTADFKKWELVATTLPGNRNLVMFPEKIGGKYWRLERPMEYLYGDERFDMWISASPDARYWGDHSLSLGLERAWWGNMKIGPSTPPPSRPTKDGSCSSTPSTSTRRAHGAGGRSGASAIRWAWCCSTSTIPPGCSACPTARSSSPRTRTPTNRKATDRTCSFPAGSSRKKTGA
jgi:beta-1,4-mannooligosaccharide/beta-1,4-mannosyl-N-acetylglucosamine phosphorylase